MEDQERKLREKGTDPFYDLGIQIEDNELLGAAIFDGTVWLVGAVGSLEVDAAKAVAGKAGTTIFKTGHYAERLAKEGIDVARAEAAVSDAVISMRPNMSTGATVSGRVMVDGVLLEYRVYPLQNGSINVGTIFPVKP